MSVAATTAAPSPSITSDNHDATTIQARERWRGMNRRRVLTASGVAGLTGLAGCNNVTTTALGSVAPPDVPEDALDEGGWALQEEESRKVFEEDYGPVTVVAKAHSLVYTDDELASRVETDTMGSVTGTFATFAATRVKFSPDLTSLPESVGRERLVDQVEANSKEQFQQRMRDAGLSDVAEVETGEMQVDTGETARYTGYEAAYEVSEFSFDLPNGDPMTIDVEAIGVAGDLAVWVHEDSVLIAGGAYPAENFAIQKSADITDAITVDVSIDLGLTPTEYSTEVESLITATR